MLFFIFQFYSPWKSFIKHSMKTLNNGEENTEIEN